MRWQLATWLDKHETPEGEHRISVVRDVDDDEVDRIREAIRVVHAYIVREPFVLVVQNQMEYQSFEDYVRSRARDDPLPLLQADAQELGSGLRFRFLNWLLSFKSFLDLTEADLHRRFGADSCEVAAFQHATRRLLWNVVAVLVAQSLTAERLLGRLNSAVNTVSGGAIPLGAALDGVLARVSLRLSYILGAVLLCAMAFCRRAHEGPSHNRRG